MERYTLRIAGMELPLRSDEPKAYVDGLERMLNARITKMLNDAPQMPLQQAAVFCALEYLDECLKATARLEKVQEANDQLTKDNAQLRADNGELIAMIDDSGLGSASLFGTDEADKGDA